MIKWQNFRVGLWSEKVRKKVSEKSFLPKNKKPLLKVVNLVEKYFFTSITVAILSVNKKEAQYAL
jgi:hypothetical protein